MRNSVRHTLPGSFILKADIEGQVSCSVSARDGLSLKDVFWEKLENTGGRKCDNYLVFTKCTRVYIEWEMNCSCVKGHALIIVNKMDQRPRALDGAHHFISKDIIHVAAAPYCEKDFYYIIRPSGKNLGSFALVITTPSNPSGESLLRHVTIGYDREHDKFSLCSKQFDSLDLLVTFFKGTAIKAHNGPEMFLRYPIPVDPRLEEECKQRCRLTRSGKRTDSSPDLDTISLWSCSSTATINSAFSTPPVSLYDYDGSISGGSISGQSEDEQPYDFPRQISSLSKSRSSTVISRDSTTDNLGSLCSSQYSTDADVIMRGQSTSSSGASNSEAGSFTGSAVIKEGTSPERRFYNQPRPLQSRGQRPQSELMRKKTMEVEQQRSCSLAPHHLFQVGPPKREGDGCLAEPEETYVLMTPSPSTPAAPSPLTSPASPAMRSLSPLTPDPLSLETMKRHPMYSRHHSGTEDPMYSRHSSETEDPNSRTLTRAPEAPEATYVTMGPPPEEPCETYVEMGMVDGMLRPVPLQGMQHDYVNRQSLPPASMASPTALYQNVMLARNGTVQQNLMVAQNLMVPQNLTIPQNTLDPETAQKLIANVETLMATVKEQTTDILSLKNTVKNLRLKIVELERFNAQEFEYE